MSSSMRLQGLNELGLIISVLHLWSLVADTFTLFVCSSLIPVSGTIAK